MKKFTHLLLKKAMTNRYEDKLHNTLDAKKRLPKLSEEDLHFKISEYLFYTLKKEVAWTTFEVSNQQGGHRGRLKQIKLKKKGVKIGWPDVQLFWASDTIIGYTKSLFLEIKTPQGVVSPVQRACHTHLLGVNIPTVIVRSVDDVREVIRIHGIPSVEVW